MIVSLAELKGVLDLDLDATDEDEYLTRLIASATAWVQGETHRRFDVPTPVVEVRDGNGRKNLYLKGHVDEVLLGDDAPTVIVAAPGALQDETSVPTGPLLYELPVGFILDFGSSKFAKLTAAAKADDLSLETEPLPRNLLPGDEANIPRNVRVSRRSLYSSDDWEALTADEDYKQRGDVLFAMWGVWSRCDEYRLEYSDGYVNPPEDIKSLVLELAQNQYLLNESSAEGTAGITSETLGDYSYTVDLGAVAVGSGGLSSNSTRTLNHYRRLHG